ncbi:NUDIX hydrolase [Glaciecola sp. 2405UD65-10]|uniref:NUDIX hydrolase n=1 Tax=Glaciecola sp. 2405UD65-10 TaxID=3397244 RepID=UPI003B5C134F
MWLCKNCGFEYFHNVAASVAAIIISDKEVLFTVREKPPMRDYLDLPGGFVDPKESLEDALSREVKEELGLELTNWQFFTSFPNTYQYKDVTYKTCDSFFICRLKDKPELTIEVSEIQSYEWMALNKVNFDQIGFSSVRHVIKHLIRESAYSLSLITNTA